MVRSPIRPPLKSSAARRPRVRLKAPAARRNPVSTPTSLPFSAPSAISQRVSWLNAPGGSRWVRRSSLYLKSHKYSIRQADRSTRVFVNRWNYDSLITLTKFEFTLTIWLGAPRWRTFSRICLRESYRIAPGIYAPQTQAGETILAHELAHVVQQSQSLNGASYRTASELEREAARAPLSTERRMLPTGAPIRDAYRNSK